MTRRYVTLPNGRRCGLGVYVAAWRALRAMPGELETFGFSYFPEPVEVILRALRHGMHDRINRHIPGFGTGRKWSDDWQRAAGQCAREVNTPRLIVRAVPPDLRARLAHRIHSEEG